MALSHFGNFTEKALPGSFKDTANALEKRGFLLKDTLTVIDDYHPALQKNQAARMETTVQEITRAYGDRTGRARMNSDTSLRKTFIPRGNLIITGEDVPNIGQSGTARHLMLEVKQGDIDMDLLTDLQAAKDKLNLAMRGYIEWLIPLANKLPQRLEANFLEYRDMARNESNHGRMAEMVAWLQVGFDMLMEYALSHGFPAGIAADWKEKSFELFAALSEEQNRRIADDQPTVKFINALRELLNTGQCYVTQPAAELSADGLKEDGFIGYFDDDYYYLYSDTTYKEVVQFYNKQGLNFPVTATTLLKQLDYAGWIFSENKDGRVNRLKQKKIANRNIRFVWLRKASHCEPHT